MADPADVIPSEERARRAIEREVEAASFYAPPAEDRPPPAARPSPGIGPSPFLVGFLTLLATTFVSSLVAGGAMWLWYETTPIGTGFLAGLSETIMAFLSWIALTMFALLSGMAVAAGQLGRAREVSATGWGVTIVLAIGAAVVCFLPEPTSTFARRGMLGLAVQAISLLLTWLSLRFAGRKWLGPPLSPSSDAG